MNDLILKFENHDAFEPFEKWSTVFIVFFTITFWELHFFCYLAAIFKHIEKENM